MNHVQSGLKLSQRLSLLLIFLLLATPLLSSPPAEAAARSRVTVQNNTVVSSSGAILRGGPMTLSKNAYNLNDGGTNWMLDVNNWIRMKNSGLNIVRVVLFDFFNTSTWNPAHPANEDRPVWTIPEILDKLDVAVDNAETAGMYIVINYHDVGDFDPVLLNAFWTAAAGRYANRAHVLYEVANEPVTWTPDKYTNQKLDDLAAAYKIIRDLAPDTHVIHLTFPAPSQNMVPVVNNYLSRLSLIGITISFADGKDSIGFHTYGTNSSSFIPNLKANFPVFCTEWGYPADVQTLDGKLYHGEVLEGLGISWMDWKAGRKDSDFVDLYQREFLADARQKNYAWTSEFFADGFNHNFNADTVGSGSFGWTVNGTATVQAIPSNANRSIRLSDNSTTAHTEISHGFTAQAANVALEFKFMQPSVVDWFQVQLREGAAKGPVFLTKGGKLVYIDNADVQHNIQSYVADTWYTIVLAANASTDTYDIFINGVLMVADATFNNAAATLDGVYFVSGNAQTGITYVDNVIVSNP